MIRRPPRAPAEVADAPSAGPRRPWRSGVVQVWLWAFLCLILTIGALSTSTILAPIFMWCVLFIVLRGALAAAGSFRGLKDWRQ